MQTSYALLFAVLLLGAVFTADAVKNRKRRKQRKALRLNQKGVFATTTVASSAPKLKAGKACITTDKVLVGQCFPWVYKATFAGSLPLDGSAIVIRDQETLLDESATYLQIEATGLDFTLDHEAVGYNFPCEINRGGPRPYQHYEHSASTYGLTGYVDEEGEAVNATEFEGNLFQATREGTTNGFANTALIFNNVEENQFEYLVRNELRSIVVFQDGVRTLCCNLEAQAKPAAKKNKKKVVKKEVTKKQAN